MRGDISRKLIVALDIAPGRLVVRALINIGRGAAVKSLHHMGTILTLLTKAVQIASKGKKFTTWVSVQGDSLAYLYHSRF